MRVLRKVMTSDKFEKGFDERKEASGTQPRTVRGRRNDAGHKRLTDEANKYKLGRSTKN